MNTIPKYFCQEEIVCIAPIITQIKYNGTIYFITISQLIQIITYSYKHFYTIKLILKQCLKLTMNINGWWMKTEDNCYTFILSHKAQYLILNSLDFKQLYVSVIPNWRINIPRKTSEVCYNSTIKPIITIIWEQLLENDKI